MRIYNTYSRQKEEFVPLVPGQVRMYVCGMTVYDLCHIGHARVMVAFDVVARYLRWSGYQVHYVRNITDIDDKIIRRAKENGESCDALVERFIGAMDEDSTALGVMRPDQEPRATAYIPQIVAMNETLVQRGHAYAATNGDVYYSVKSFADYGALAHKNLDDLMAGARVEIGEAKRDPLDFVLWKAAKPGEPHWSSPWGEGRPGWHIECSAMSTCCLGNSLDIHGGGGDLQFPHHENEIAQSEGATGEKFVNHWMHVGFVQVNEEKMSKSLGNFFTIRDVLKEYRPEVIRYFIVASHYLSPLNYSEDNLEHSRAALERFYLTLKGVESILPEREDEWVSRFRAAMDDDFNTPEALAVLFDLAREINRHLKTEQAEEARRLAGRLKQLAGVLGILQDAPEHYLQSGGRAEKHATIDDAEIERLVAARTAAKQNRDFAEADRIRNVLSSEGVTLEDSRQGTLWRRV